MIILAIFLAISGLLLIRKGNKLLRKGQKPPNTPDMFNYFPNTNKDIEQNHTDIEQKNKFIY